MTRDTPELLDNIRRQLLLNRGFHISFEGLAQLTQNDVLPFCYEFRIPAYSDVIQYHENFDKSSCQGLSINSLNREDDWRPFFPDCIPIAMLSSTRAFTQLLCPFFNVIIREIVKPLKNWMYEQITKEFASFTFSEIDPNFPVTIGGIFCSIICGYLSSTDFHRVWSWIHFSSHFELEEFSKKWLINHEKYD